MNLETKELNLTRKDHFSVYCICSLSSTNINSAHLNICPVLGKTMSALGLFYCYYLNFAQDAIHSHSWNLKSLKRHIH